MTNPFTSLRSASAHFLGSWRVFYGRYFPPASAGAGTATLNLCDARVVSLSARRGARSLMPTSRTVTLTPRRGAKALCP